MTGVCLSLSVGDLLIQRPLELQRREWSVQSYDCKSACMCSPLSSPFVHAHPFSLACLHSSSLRLLLHVQPLNVDPVSL
jgi:hypothetical protein